MKRILAVDAYVTDIFVKVAEKLLAFQQFRTHYQVLEVRKYKISLSPKTMNVPLRFTIQNVFITLQAWLMVR